MFEVVEPVNRKPNEPEYAVSRGMVSESNFRVQYLDVQSTVLRDPELLAYYFSALRDSSPVAQFKNFYNVLEYFFEDAPVFVGSSASKETEQIEAVFRWATTDSALRTVLNAMPKEVAKRLQNMRVTSSSEPIPAVDFRAPDILKSYSLHVYSLRNACLHSKRTRKGKPTPRIAPSTEEEAILSDELPIMQWLAVMCIEKWSAAQSPPSN